MKRLNKDFSIIEMYIYKEFHTIFLVRIEPFLVAHGNHRWKYLSLMLSLKTRRESKRIMINNLKL